jgi:DNA-binding response OmpR family regulator
MTGSVLVDDDEDVASLIALQLTLSNYAVTERASVDAASPIATR